MDSEGRKPKRSVHMTRRSILIAVIAAMTVTVLVGAAAAQVAGATLSGTVADASGAVIPNATILIKNTATGVVRQVTTNANGLYIAPNLLPGSYSVSTEAKGFAQVRSEERRVGKECRYRWQEDDHR